MTKVLLDVRGLSRRFDVSQPWLNRKIEGTGKLYVNAVDDVSFTVKKRVGQIHHRAADRGPAQTQRRRYRV